MCRTTLRIRGNPVFERKKSWRYNPQTPITPKSQSGILSSPPPRYPPPIPFHDLTKVPNCSNLCASSDILDCTAACIGCVHGHRRAASSSTSSSWTAWASIVLKTPQSRSLTTAAPPAPASMIGGRTTSRMTRWSEAGAHWRMSTARCQRRSSERVYPGRNAIVESRMVRSREQQARAGRTCSMRVR